MNWTEGVLARHSRRKGWDKDAARQKQYFAKARARKENPALKRYRDLDPADFIPGYIPSLEGTEGRGSSSSTPQRRQHTPRKGLFQNRDGTDESSGRSSNRSASLQHGKPAAESLVHERMPPVDENRRETDLAQKRRKLLEMPDWVGVSLQKPIIVGRKARRDHPGNRAFRRDSQPNWEVHQANAFRQRPDFESHYSRRNLGHQDNDRMRIRIGSQNLRWSRDSNTVRSLAPSTAPHAGYHTRMAGNRGSKRPSTSSHLIFGTDSLLETPSRVIDPSYHAVLDFGSDRSVPSLSATSQRSSYQQSASNELPYVIRSSPPVIHHPQPTRGRPLAVFGIHSGESQENDSTVAVDGAPKSPPNRVRPDNIRWNTWLSGQLQGGLRKPAEGVQEPRPSRSITPGISQHWDGSEDTSDTPTSDHNEASGAVDDSTENCQSSAPSNDSVSFAPSTDGLDTLESQQDIPDVFQERHGLRASEGQLRGYSAAIASSRYTESNASIKPGSDLVLPTRIELPKDPNVHDLMELLVANEENLADHNENGQEERDPSPESDDEVWKKFVFDDSPAETSRQARKEAREKALEEVCEATKQNRRLKEAEPLSDIAEPSSASIRDLAAEPPSDVAEPPSTFREKTSDLAPTLTMTEGRSDILACASEVQVSSEPAAPADMTDANTSTVAQASSPRPPPSDFKFHQPRLFTGRLVSDGSGNTQSVPSRAPPERGRRPKSRRRRDHGRPDFRAIPDYHEDPIDD